MPKKKARRGRPRTTGRGTLVGLRCHAPFLTAVDAWRKRQDDKPSRPAAVVRLAVLGLSLSGPSSRNSEMTASTASALAAEEIDRLADQSVTADVRASRKRRLLKGPKEFREIRKDKSRKPTN